MHDPLVHHNNHSTIRVEGNPTPWNQWQPITMRVERNRTPWQQSRLLFFRVRWRTPERNDTILAAAR